MALLLCTAVSGFAVSMGRLRGSAIVGRGLDVTVLGQLENAESVASICPEADVFFGDTRLLPAKVVVSKEAGAVAGEVQIRVRTTAVIDEPVVTVYVRESCNQKTTRKYVILSDVLSDNGAQVPLPLVDASAGTASLGVSAAPGRDTAANTTNASANPLAATGAAAAAAKAKGRGRTGYRASAPSLAAQAPAAEAEPAPARFPSARISPARAASARSSGRATQPQPESPARSGARLKLDPIDLAGARDPVLRYSSELLSQPSEDLQQRAAAAAFWQALNAQPQDIVRDNQRMKALEKDLANLSVQNRQGKEAVSQLQSQLDKASTERYANWFTYALGALALVSLAGLGALWSQRNAVTRVAEPKAWWGKASISKTGLDSRNRDVRAASIVRPSTDAHNENRPVLDSTLDVDLGVDEAQFASMKMAQAKPPAAAPEPLAPLDSADFLPSLAHSSRTVNAEELFDVQQQADFFISLGQFDQAVEVLRDHITDNVETSALAYLDLLDLYHRLGRQEDYETLRKDFNRVFNAQVPAYAGYTVENEGLESYTSAFSRIESLWPTPKVLHVIEESIFRKPGIEGDAFNLKAYRELLLLYSVAKDIVDKPTTELDFQLSGSASAPAPDHGSFEHRAAQFVTTNVAPLSTSLGNAPTAKANEVAATTPLPTVDLTVPPASLRLGLDLDLSGEPAPAPPASSKYSRKAATPPTPAEGDNLIEFDAVALNPVRSWLKGK